MPSTNGPFPHQSEFTAAQWLRDFYPVWATARMELLRDGFGQVQIRDPIRFPTPVPVYQGGDHTVVIGADRVDGGGGGGRDPLETAESQISDPTSVAVPSDPSVSAPATSTPAPSSASSASSATSSSTNLGTLTAASSATPSTSYPGAFTVASSATDTGPLPEYIQGTACSCGTTSAEPDAWMLKSTYDDAIAAGLNCPTGRLPDGSCWEILPGATTTTSAPAPARTLAYYGAGGCCICCDSCTKSTRTIRNVTGCPFETTDTDDVVVCDPPEGCVDVGYGISRSYTLGSTCAPDVYEHWWTTKQGVTNYWYRHTIHGTDCEPTVTTGSDSLSSASSCTQTAQYFRMYELFGAPYPFSPNLSLECDGDCGSLTQIRLSSTANSSTFSATTYQADGFGGCAIAWIVNGWSYRIPLGTGGCGGTCDPSEWLPPIPGVGSLIDQI